MHLLSVGALRGQFPSWTVSMPASHLDDTFYVLDEAGVLRIQAVNLNDLYLWDCAALTSSARTESSARLRSSALLLAAVQRGPLAGSPPAVSTSAPVVAAFPSLDLLGSDLPLPPSSPLSPAAAAAVPAVLVPGSRFSRFLYLHRVLGHPSLRRMAWLQRVFPWLALGTFPASLFCQICNEAKSRRGNVAKVAPASSRIPKDAFFDRGHVDIKQSTIAGVGGVLYTAIVLSEKTGVLWALHTKEKGELASKLVTFKLMYDAHFAATNGPMLFFRADNDKAIFPAATQAFWDGYGVIRQFSPAYTPNRNGRSESSIRTGYMVARALLRDSPVPDLLWPYAVDHACYILARRPTRAAPLTTPWARLTGRQPGLSLIGWGSVGHWTPPPEHPRQSKRHTFSSRGFACPFLGFAPNSETTMLVWSGGAVYATCDAVFPRMGALMLTRDLPHGSLNYGLAAPLETRNELFAEGPFPPAGGSAALELLSSPVRPLILHGRPIFVGAHDLDCYLCVAHRAGRMLLCCELCSRVAHISCAGLKRAPEGDWLCGSCASAVHADPISAAAPLSLDVFSAPQTFSGVVPCLVAPVPSEIATVDPVILVPEPEVPVPAIFLADPVPGVVPVAAPVALDDLRARFIEEGPADVPSEDEALPTGPVILAAVQGDPADKRLRRLLVVRNRASLGLPVRPAAPRIGLSCPDFAASWALTAVSGQQLPLARPPPLRLRDVVAKPLPFPVGLLESPESSWLPRSPTPGLREIPALFPSPREVLTGGMPIRLQRLSNLLRLGDPPVCSAPAAPALASARVETWPLNPLCYPLFSTASEGMDDIGSRCYVSMAGYRDSEPRLGEGFAHDAKRIARAGMTMKEALQTSDAAQFIAADLRERDKLLEGSLKPVRREDALGAQISWRHLCSTKPHKTGDAKFDVRLCLHGFRQQPHTYDPNRVSTSVAQATSVKMTQAWASDQESCESEVKDADRAFLQAALTQFDSPMWIEPPASWGLPKGTVLQVMNSVYGLKQACFNWCEKLDGVLFNGGAIPFLQDPRSFILCTRKGGKLCKTFLHAHVDDMKIIGHDVAAMSRLIDAKIKTTSKGSRPAQFCGLQYEYGKNGEVFMHMSDTIASLIALCEASGVSLAGIPCPLTPMLPGVASDLMRTYASDGLIPPNDKWYRSAIGVNNWLEGGVRVDISFAFNVLSSALGKNTPAHDQALLRLIVWLRDHNTHGLVYGGDRSAATRGFMGFTDSSFADGEFAKSTQGFAIKFNACLIKWNSRRQPCVALDTMEAEYIAAAQYCRALLGLLNILGDMMMEQGPVPSFEDLSLRSP